MKKTAQNTSKLNPTNFVRRVLSRTSSNHSKTTLDTNETEKPMGTRDKIPIDFEQELSVLKKQVSSLQISVNSMQRDTERKEVALASLSKEREQLTIDLKKQKRSNVNLKQQLEDERGFYYKEKEQFCHEMNTVKRMKQKSSSKESSVRDFNENNYKNEIAKLKDDLSQALEANYNLSVKFLRMKNTKLGLKQQLIKMRELHEVGVQEHVKLVEAIKKELDDVVQEQFTKPIPPSSKKYLQVLKHNGSLIHENLCLQLEMDRLHLELEKLKISQMKNHTNSKLKFIRRSTEGSNKTSKSTASITEKNDSTVSITNTNNKNNHLKQSNDAKNENSIVTNNSKRTEVLYTSKNNPYSNSTTTDIRSNLVDGNNPFNLTENSDRSTSVRNQETPKKGIQDASKFELMNVSNSNLSSQINDSDLSYYTSVKCCQAYRTQSAPEIVQSTQDLT